MKREFLDGLRKTFRRQGSGILVDSKLNSVFCEHYSLNLDSNITRINILCAESVLYSFLHCTSLF